MCPAWSSSQVRVVDGFRRRLLLERVCGRGGDGERIIVGRLVRRAGYAFLACTSHTEWRERLQERQLVFCATEMGSHFVWLRFLS
ncbi:uncharacterized protein [Physcomitrium patens]|uniref:uncharacterized protein isoform X3 n=1 Tax=Physcomitrium patens TaxID=3218 RepID=UPI003CCE357F